jgi:2-polyprenyl-3-methyl-5-hydroxy-6-metoxy-1,4-benzoquinol methylase
MTEAHQESAWTRRIRGAFTIVRRRGLGYVTYLVGGVAWPKAGHRLLSSSMPWRALRSLFVAGSAVTTSSATDDQLEGLGVLSRATEGRTGSEQPAPEAVEALMTRAHAANLTGIRRGFAHLVKLPDGSAAFAQLPGVRRHRSRGIAFAIDRDVDRQAFNEAYGASILTEASARTLLRDVRAKATGYRNYAPIDFGGGLTVGRFMSTDSGTGRWDFFNSRVVAPIVKGKRVLDLGSNNGSLLLMMLRAGASAVVGLELTPSIADVARLNARILCWRDMCAYDIQVLTRDMRCFLTEDLGRFDVVTAFCSLYYVPADDMARVIQRAARMGAQLILQANESIGNLPAQASVLRNIMAQNGYPIVTVYEEQDFVRPLLVGQAPVGSAALV